MQKTNKNTNNSSTSKFGVQVEKFELPPIETNAYLLYNQDKGQAILIDTSMEAWERISERLKQIECTLIALFLTHGHWDHMMDSACIAAKGIPVYAHSGDEHMIRQPSIQMVFSRHGFTVQPAKIDHFVQDGQILDFLDQEIQVRHVPGHSQGSVIYYFKTLKAAFVGDVIFAGSIGRTDFPGCSAEVLKRSIQEKVFSLPEDTLLYPGHGPHTTVIHEQKNNPYVYA
jgi:hydroxyacylglutathione hydrolase